MFYFSICLLFIARQMDKNAEKQEKTLHNMNL